MHLNSSDKYPFFAKSALVLIGVISLTYLVILGKEILSPLLFSFIFAILLLPIAKFLETSLRVPRNAASFAAVVLWFGALSLVIYIVCTQVEDLSEDWPLFKEQLLKSTGSIQMWIERKFGIGAAKQMKYVQDTTSGFLASGTLLFGATIASVSSILLFLVFNFIYTFFFLLYRRLILKFLLQVFKEENSIVVKEVVVEIQLIIRKYVVGLMLQMGIVAAVVCAAFFLLNIKYAILLGLITGLFNIIPYVGIFTALVISTLITFATAGALFKVLLVAIVIIVMHLIDSNILLPLVVGSKVKINAFITVLGVVLGEMIWGISGMFLSIPVIAVLKIIFDRIEGLKPWGLLLGEDEEVKKEIDRKEELLKSGTILN
ncbi:MAG TPA: AI-2E family transporter [Cytophagaceae bacterium]|jgi:predicted PurR-regulated permease PerM